jgi:hypothetical protein
MSGFWGSVFADSCQVSPDSPQKPPTPVDFCAHLQVIRKAVVLTIPPPGQKAVDG